MLTLALFLLLTVKAVKTESLMLFFLSGFTFSLAALNRGVILPFLVLIFVWFGFLFRKRAVKILAVFILGFTFLLSPWVVRNYMIFKKFIPSTTRFGDVLYQGYNPLASGGSGGWWPIGREYIYPEAINSMDEIERSKFLTGEAYRFIIKNPLRVLILSLRKAVNMWRPFYTPTSVPSKIIMFLSFCPVFILGIAGLIKTWNPGKPSFLLHLLVLYYFIIHALLISTIRYRWPVMPFIIILAAFSVNQIIENLSPGKNGCLLKE